MRKLTEIKIPEKAKIEPEKWLTPKELAERWKVKVQTLNNWRFFGKPPRFSKLGGVRYLLSDIIDYENKKRG